MKKIIIIIMFSMFSLVSFSNPKVVFINPGKSNETFWVMVSNFMQAAANDLDINLEIVYAERQFLNAVKLMEELSSSKGKPDCVIIVNEKLIAPSLLEIADKNNLTTFMILNDLTIEQKEKDGIPRDTHPNWIGSLIPDNIKAGYLTADSLINEAKKIKDQKKFNLIAIAGNRATPASVERVNGLNKSLIENPNVKLEQTVYAEWDEQNAYLITNGILKRYKDIDIIWAVNDPSAFGAIRACEEHDIIPGIDVFIGGLNWSNAAFEEIKKGKMVSSIGGHFMVGGWALVILKDYFEGLDFKDTERDTQLKINVFDTINSSNVNNYLKYFGDSDWEKIDFKKFSKFYNNEIKSYDFSLNKILDQF